MKVCGVELKDKEAVVAIISHNDGLFDVHHTRVPKIAVKDISDKNDLRSFQFAFEKLMADYQVTDVVIKERHSKGKFAGSTSSFKLEAALQLSLTLNVDLLSSSDVKEQLKYAPLPISCKDAGLKPFQDTAFTTAFCYLNKCIRKEKDPYQNYKSDEQK